MGSAVSENNEATYIGYSEEFVFVLDRNYLKRPLDDPMAKPFMNSSNQVMVSILKGHSAQEASDRSKKLFRNYFSELASSKASKDSLQSAQFLWWNMRNQVCLGNGQAKLPQR